MGKRFNSSTTNVPDLILTYFIVAYLSIYCYTNQCWDKTDNVVAGPARLRLRDAETLQNEPSSVCVTMSKSPFI